MKRSMRMTQGRQTALTCLVAGALCEVVLCLVLHRWPPVAVPFGAGLGSAGYLFMLGRQADDVPSWFGVTLAVCASIGVLISLAIWGA